MNSSELNNMNKNELIKVAKQLEISYTGTKKIIIDNILDRRKEQYIIINQLGDAGKDAKTYYVKLGRKQYAMKQFKPRKSVKKIEDEVELQLIAAKSNISPDIIEVNEKHKYIVMNKLDKHLVDIHDEKKISLDHQKQLIKIYKILDEQGIFHGDPNPLNYMIKNKKLYVIDFGMSKKIDSKLEKKLNTNQPNLTIMTLAMVLKLKAMNYPKDSYSYLLSHIPVETRDKFHLI